MALSRFFRRRLVDPLLALLKRGVTPSQLSLAITLGIVFAIIPVFGATTLLSLAAISILRINPLAILLVNQFSYPLQFICYIPFIKAGHWLFLSDNPSFSVEQVFEMFASDIFNAINVLWWSTLYALVIWLGVSLVLGTLVYFFFRKIFETILLSNRLE